MADEAEPKPVDKDTFKLGFIGAGNLSGSIATGLVKLGILPASRIFTAHRNPESRVAFTSIGIKVFQQNRQVVEECDVIILGVKPQILEGVMLELGPLLSPDKLLVSLAVGHKLKVLQKWAGHGRFIRVLPSTACAIGEAAIAMHLGEDATEEDGELISNLFGAVGKVWKLDEKLSDAAGTISGAGTAFVYIAIEAMADGGVAAGLPRDIALGFAAQAFYGAAAMVMKTGKHPGQLKDQVASPGGTTIAGIHELEKGAFRASLMSAVVASTKRSQEMSQ
ncbi:hypothetical protein FEM48_Zijuj12G0018400 [Ziziphus jujuba var. spinosa]|uniref:Pyrroline-5-carboxylate reductase n=1 Tax=Ziziphus jujuba var. spinosa TaxID=714518 RepID=A0A978UAI1_ZIZJJ|nr:hypothetical protein FEM48_Zijuj12G0018400 [Ziziphus jujuba var. spinosa]